MFSFPHAGLTRRARPGFVCLLLCVAALLLGGCAGRLQKASDLYYAGNPGEALEQLEKGGDGGKSRLLFLVERGVVAHELGDYRKSRDNLLAAAELLESFETIRASEQLAGLVTTDWLKNYQGEYSERLWVHTYLMMDFLMLGEYDSAQVEARRALKLFDAYPEVLRQDYFTRALMGLCFALVGEDNDAYLIYRKLAEDLPSPRPVAGDLVRLAGRLGQMDEVQRYRPYLPENAERGGELVLFVASGRIPEKHPGNVVLPPTIRFSFPYYRTTSSPALPLTVSAPRSAWPPISSDLARLVVGSLDERKGRIIVLETARVAGKEAIAQGVGNQFGDAAELLTRLSLFLLEEPDTRSWQILPGRLTLVRVPLPAGHHKLQVRAPGLGPWRAATVELPEFELRPGQRVFYSLRF